MLLGGRGGGPKMPPNWAMAGAAPTRLATTSTAQQPDRRIAGLAAGRPPPPLDDYRLLAAVQEERLTRHKGSGDGIPWLAIDEVLRIAGWTRRDVDAIASTRAFYPAIYLRPSLFK